MKNKNQIWIVEDDAGARFVYQEILGGQYHLELFDNLADFARQLTSDALAPDLIIADLSLAEENFLDFLGEKNTARLLQAPFMIISSVDDAEILRTCFDGGAVDYLTKPFTKNELIVKVERIISGLNHRRVPVFEPFEGSIQLDLMTQTVQRGAHSVILTTKELRIFSLLFQADGTKITRKKLEIEIWGNQTVTPKTLDVHLFNLRKKLSKLQIEIRFIQPDGYALQQNS